MAKLKWSYDKKHKQWYIIESPPYANNGIDIKKSDNEYILSFDAFMSKYRFKKLSSAKKVAQLIHNG